MLIFTLCFVLLLIRLKIKFTKNELERRNESRNYWNFHPHITCQNNGTINNKISELPIQILFIVWTFRCHLSQQPTTLIRAHHFNRDNSWIKKKHNQCHWYDYYWSKPKQSLFYLFIFSLELFTDNKFRVVLETCLFCVKFSCPETHKKKVNVKCWWLIATYLYTRYARTSRQLFIRV